MRIRHHQGSAHPLEPGKMIAEGCLSCEDERISNTRPLITDESLNFHHSDWYVVWERSDGFIGCTTYHPGRVNDPNFRFTILLQTADWTAAHMVIRAYRTAAVMNNDIQPIVKTAQSNILGVLL